MGITPLESKIKPEKRVSEDMISTQRVDLRTLKTTAIIDLLEDALTRREGRLQDRLKR